MVQAKTIWPVVLQRPPHDFETNISPCDPTLHILVRLFIYHLTSELNFNERLSKFLNWFMHCPELCAKWIAVLYRLDSFFSGSLHIRPPGRIFLYLKENYSKRNLKFHFIILREFQIRRVEKEHNVLLWAFSALSVLWQAVQKIRLNFSNFLTKRKASLHYLCESRISYSVGWHSMVLSFSIHTFNNCNYQLRPSKTVHKKIDNILVFFNLRWSD